MCERWHIISQTMDDFPAPNQEIYCCIVDGDSVSDVRKVITDLKALKDLVTIHPTWKILWQPMPAPPNPPSYTVVFPCRKEVHHG